MGQYWKTVNLDKREFLDPHDLGDGLKLKEQMGGGGGVANALLVLLACSNGRGGGDFHAEDPKKIIGRWAGDRIAVIGDYAEPKDLPSVESPSLVYSLCCSDSDYELMLRDVEDHAEQLVFELKERELSKLKRLRALGNYTNISFEVADLMTRERIATYSGSGWRKRESRYAADRVMVPDILL